MVQEIAQFIRTTIIGKDAKPVSFRLNPTHGRIVSNGGLALTVCRHYLDLWTPLGSLRIWENKGDELIPEEDVFMSRFRDVRHKFGLSLINDEKQHPIYIVVKVLDFFLPIAFVPVESVDGSFWKFDDKCVTLKLVKVKLVKVRGGYKCEIIKQNIKSPFLLETDNIFRKIWEKVKPVKKLKWQTVHW